MTLRSEIFEQPDVLRGALSANQSIAARARDMLTGAGIGHILIAARGTSDNAARYAKYAWGTKLSMPVTLAAPSLYTKYQQPPDLSSAAVVGISQSGQSPDLLAVLTEGRRQGRPTIAITNDPESPMADIVDLVVPLKAGPERSVAATKTYTASLLAIAMIADDVVDLDEIPGSVAGALDAEQAIVAAVERTGPMPDAVILGRGYNRSTAFEWALKLQEMAYVLANPFSTADFAHGPFAVLEQDFPLLAVVPAGVIADDNLTLVRRARDEGDARITLLTNIDVPDLPTVNLPMIEEWLSPIMFIVAAQLFTLHAASLAGVDPETPRGLRKVTRTT
ncbi:MAG: SIS domain-containing protein [Actinomycetia bacterium]|nr:SIS domain-containing protein [Actinomycetes bacterium]